MAGLLGRKPSRHFKLYRETFPAIFRFNGKLFQEHYNLDTNAVEWIEIDEATAHRFLTGSTNIETIESI